MAKRPAFALPSPPPLRAIPIRGDDSGGETLILTSTQREHLAHIAVRIRLPARMAVYREEALAESVYAIAEGCVKCYRDLPSGRRTLCAFLFAHDLFGLAERGRYVNTVQAVTNVTLFRLSRPQLIEMLKYDGDLQLQFFAKVTHELRASHRRAILTGRRDAAGRLAMFIAMMASPRVAASGQEVPLPMTRTDIADFLGLSLESVSRAAAGLERDRLVAFETRHLARILDGDRLARLVAAV